MTETTHIPITFRPRGGKTVIVMPDGSRGVVRREATIDNTMVKVIANPSYISRILRLAFLSPVVVQAILDGSHPAWLTMRDLLEPFPMDWQLQEKKFLARFEESNLTSEY
jgi:hypothetical protein